ncbi:WD repeat and HMG-box DNA-binding protein 1 [Macadamia integrifolia]|uniref:WD repeat and HMG-box DNA-binding protein 1 n=1 Tax=Macadamia integrifolia TaxID=60698 RepID=UPI001C4EEEBD|nr:WD repeat and HMG-box DNA-binding protein 1 [Macadamia integrifolia]
MKGRLLKLKEAHKNNGVSSFCSILWDLQAQHLVTSSAADSTLSIHDLSHTSKPPKILSHHKDGVTALALSPNSTCLASGSVDHSVKLYKFPGGEFQTNVTRFTLPIRALAFNKSGSLLAAAGDDEGIKLINTIDGSISRVLKGHKGPVTGLSFDPNSEYLASVDSIGTVIYWGLCSGEIIHTLKGVAPDLYSEDSVLNILSWSPDGEILAVPGLKNDVVMYDRDTAQKQFSLRGDHRQSICFLSWSPNGKYIATSGLDRQVLIWDVDRREDIDRQKFDDIICCMAWKPIGNALAVIDVMGRFGVLESTIPLSMKSPTDGASSLRSKNSNGLLLFDEEDQVPDISGTSSDIGEDNFGESEPVSRKRLRKKTEFDDNLDENTNDHGALLPMVEVRKKGSLNHKEMLIDKNDNLGFRTATTSQRLKMQESFQPGSTTVQAGKRHFLCYNMIGCITTIEHDGYSHIEVDFHDSGTGPRVPAMTDYFGFTMASLNENGSVFGNQCKGDKNMSTLMYRPFSSWENNSEWSMRFEAEEVKVVALGTGWVAAVTNLNFLRIFTEGGLQKHVLSINGPVVTAAGFKDELAIVNHASHCLPSNDQMLEFKIFKIYDATQSFCGPLPLTPGSCLTWLGFSEEGQLSSYDSKGVLRVFTNQYGGSWLPIFSSSKEKESEKNYWVVGLNTSKLFCVVCESPDTFPPVTPKPVLTLLNLSIPLASSDLGAGDLENEFMLNNLYLSQILKRIDEMSASGFDTTLLDDEAFNIEAALDKCILRLIAACCNGDKLVRATELVKLLSLDKSVRGAIKLVTALKLPILAERFNGVLEERLLNETRGTVGNQNPTSGTAFAHVAHKALPAADQFPSPLFSKHDKEEVPAKVGGEKKKTDSVVDMGSMKNEAHQVNLHRPSNPFATNQERQERATAGRQKMETDGVVGPGKTKDGENQVMFHRPSNLFAKASSIDEEKAQEKAKVGGQIESNSVDGIGQVQFHRPSNPFAKASTNQEGKQSLLDSIKKMKKVDTLGKR